MKNITKKQWGIVGTQIGSILIIVALMSIISIGSGDTYASPNLCSCSTGTRQGNACVVTTTKTTLCCAAGQSCSAYDTCSSTAGCTYSGSGMYSCTKSIQSTTECTCPSGTKLQTSGVCEPKTDNSDDGDNDDGSSCTKANDTCTLNGKSGTCKANTSGTGFTCQVPNTPTGGGDDGSGGNGGGNNGGGNNGGGNSGGNSGGNGNSGNTGGNNGNNNGGNNATKNPNTATKAPLVIAIIGIISVGISSVLYFNGKKEINTEI